MKRMSKLIFLFLLATFLTAPLFAQEEEAEFSEEDVIMLEEPGEGVITGEVVSLDVNSSTITVKTDEGEQKTFSVVKEETILWRGIEDIELGAIKKGEQVEVGYYSDEKNILIASWVDILIEEELVPMEEIEEDIE